MSALARGRVRVERRSAGLAMVMAIVALKPVNSTNARVARQGGAVRKEGCLCGVRAYSYQWGRARARAWGLARA